MRPTRLPLAVFAGLVGLVGVVLLAAGTGEPGALMAMRATGRVALVCFAGAFAASAAVRRWPGAPAARWLRRERRGLGLSSAVAVGVHVVLLGLLYSVRTSTTGLRPPGNPAEPLIAPVSVLVIAGITVVAVAAMAASSFRAAARRLGGRRWKRLHLTGSWLVVLVATLDLADGLVREGRWTDAPFALMLAGVVALRVERAGAWRVRWVQQTVR